MKKIWLLASIMISAVTVSGQSLLDRPISFSFDDISLEEALFRLIDDSAINLSFSNSILPENKSITFTAIELPLDKVLDQLLDGTLLAYKETVSQIIIYRKGLLELESYTISGYVRDLETGENIVGAVIYDEEKKAGTYSNSFGYFSISLTEGETSLSISNLGYEKEQMSFFHDEDGQVIIELKPYWFEPILVKSFTDSTLFENSNNAYDLNIKQVSKMASLGGEADLIRTVFSLPGVQTGSDGFGGLSVRGGGIDQNLFLLDGVPVYNAMHGIGLFSIYNSSAVRSAKILKGSFPARYGGRMSSVWDVQTKEGNKKEFLGEVDIGITSGKLTLEGPINKGQGSFFFSGRRALFDFYAEPISRKLRDNGGFVTYQFDDLNLKFNYDLTKTDRVFISYYSGNDDYDDLRSLKQAFGDTITTLSDSEKVDWGNTIASLRWNHLFSDKLFGNTTFTYSLYEYGSEDFIDLLVNHRDDTLNRDVLLQLYSSTIKDVSIKTDFDYSSFKKHKIKFGSVLTWHEFSAKIASFEQAEYIDYILTDTVGDAGNMPLKSTELEFYLEDEIMLNENLHANIGLRVSSSYVLDSWHVLPQPRLLITYMPSSKSSFNFSINRVTQFLHLLSPSRLGLPKDLWVTATDKVPPQKSWQFVAGTKRKLGNGFLLNLDFYFKKMYNLPLFTGASLNGINTIDWQENVVVGRGKSYGTELLLQKHSEKWGGWLSYTLGWSNRKFPQDINNGESFPIKLDRRHNFNLQVLYKMNEKWDFAGGYTIASGSYFSLPSQEYSVVQISGVPTSIEPLIIPEGVNDQQLPVYHRLDVSANYYINHRKAKQTIKIGVTNVYNKLNPLFRTLRDKFDDDGVLSSEFVEVSLLPIFPSLRYIIELK